MPVATQRKRNGRRRKQELDQRGVARHQPAHRPQCPGETEVIGVTVHAAEFLDVYKRPVVLFELVKGWLTGTEPKLGEMHALTEPRRPA